MAWRIVKQPNGRLAKFSDVVDNFTDMDLTKPAALELCQQKLAEQAAIVKVRGGEEDWPSWTTGTQGSGLDRWRDSLLTIRRVHGDKEAIRVANVAKTSCNECVKSEKLNDSADRFCNHHRCKVTYKHLCIYGIKAE